MPIELALVAYVLAGLCVVVWLYGHFYGLPPYEQQRAVAMEPAPLAEPDFAPEAIRQLEAVRDGLLAGDLHADSAELANALQRAHIALYGPRLRGAGSPIYLPQLRAPDLIAQRIDEVLERLRGAT